MLAELDGFVPVVSGEVHCHVTVGVGGVVVEFAISGDHVVTKSFGLSSAGSEASRIFALAHAVVPPGARKNVTNLGLGFIVEGCSGESGDCLIRVSIREFREVGDCGQIVVNVQATRLIDFRVQLAKGFHHLHEANHASLANKNGRNDFRSNVRSGCAFRTKGSVRHYLPFRKNGVSVGPVVSLHASEGSKVCCQFGEYRVLVRVIRIRHDALDFNAKPGVGLIKKAKLEPTVFEEFLESCG